jgi:hypothetical protein
MGTLQTTVFGLDVEKFTLITEVVVETDDHATLVKKLINSPIVSTVREMAQAILWSIPSFDGTAP